MFHMHKEGNKIKDWGKRSSLAHIAKLIRNKTSKELSPLAY